jgi:hypothetical protein
MFCGTFIAARDLLRTDAMLTFSPPTSFSTLTPHGFEASRRVPEPARMQAKALRYRPVAASRHPEAPGDVEAIDFYEASVSEADRSQKKMLRCKIVIGRVVKNLSSFTTAGGILRICYPFRPTIVTISRLS